MPVTLQVASHASEPVRSSKATSHADLLWKADSEDARSLKRIIQSSIPTEDFDQKYLVHSANGFVTAAFRAYSTHHHLTIRPEDIWFSILSQLSFYINANAEALRDRFVAHSGKKKLEIVEQGCLGTVDMGTVARRMTTLIQENVKDPDLRDWLMPAFSTTTVCDRTVAAILVMGSMQAYFSYQLTMECGIPSVTLLGERADYEDILARLEKLCELGEEPTQFAALLRPVLRGFIATFDPAQDVASRAFWGRIAHRTDGFSGPYYLCGWVTAFCFWDNKGKCFYDVHTRSWFHGEKNSSDGVKISEHEETILPLVLEGVKYHRVDISKIPPSCASVPVFVNDNGIKYDTKMIAGSLGITVTSSSGAEVGADGGDSLQSLSGWMLYEFQEVNWEDIDYDFKRALSELKGSRHN